MEIKNDPKETTALMSDTSPEAGCQGFSSNSGSCKVSAMNFLKP